MSDTQYEGWAAFDKTAIEGNLRKHTYTPKKFQKDDIEVKILYSGICGSDLHTISEGWGDMSKSWPQVVGHEIVGEVVRAGDQVENDIKVGDIVGIGAQCDSCLSCEQCHDHKENYCDKGICGTYNGTFSRGPAKGDKAWGGYANYWRGPSHFSIKVPQGLDLAAAAPLMCAGGTVFSPLQKYGCGTTAKSVGIVGVGGLGHLAIMFAKALGAEVTAISHGKSKINDAKKMGAGDVVVTGDDAAKAVKGRERTLDLILSTSNDTNLPLDAYLSMLKPGGHLIFLGLPDGGKLPQLSIGPMVYNNVHIGASLIASPSTLKDMLHFAAEHNIQPWIKKWPMDKVNEAVVSMDKGEARYRYVLVNEHNGAKL